MIEKFLLYLELEKNYSKHTLSAYKNDLNAFEVYCKDEQIYLLEEVTYSVVRSWVVFLNAQGVTNRSINRKTTALSSFYKYLFKIGVVADNPMACHKSLKIAKKINVPFTTVEIEEVLEQDKGTEFESQRNKVMIHLFYGTGIRRAELINLQVSDVDVVLAQIKVLGKRNKERIIPMYDALVQELESYLNLRNAIDTEGEELFVTNLGNKMYPSIVYSIVNSYFSDISTKTKKSPHVLRHSFATDLLNNGADLNSVKELLGHTSLAATQVYTHTSLDRIKQVYNQTHPRGVVKIKKL